MKKLRTFAFLIMAAMVVFLKPDACSEVKAATILPANVTVAAEGNELVGLKGSYATDVQEAIDLVNQYRLEACTNGYPDPRDPERSLTLDDYIPVKWSSDLEYIARIRAAEGSIYPDHDRPNGGSCFDVVAPNGVDSYSEVLAWGGDTIVSSVSLWYTEKSTWINQESGVTGHYTSMINPNTTYMGMANFNGTGAGEFTNEEWVNFSYDSEVIVLDTTPLPEATDVIQTVEVPKADLSGLTPSITTTISYGETGSISLSYKYQQNTEVLYLGQVQWSANSNKIRLSADGTITPKKVGNYKVTFTYSGDQSGRITKTIRVRTQVPSIKNIKATKTSAKVLFKKVSGASGYQIRYTYNEYWTPKRKTISVGKKTSVKTIKGLSRKTYYYFQIRSYRKVGKKTYYSKWSDYVTRKTK